jgi:hypothetical protein
MNTLTSNRIIEEGDEYLLDGKWQPVTEKVIGMQIGFSGLSQVRRPSETPSSASIISPTPRFNAVAAESNNAPVPSCSGTGVTLPTVVSVKAHTMPAPSPSISIMFPKGAAKCIWIGRNGAFNQTAINMINVGEKIHIVPQGVRGIAKNAVIEFPASIIPQIIKWLEAQK